jgi:predicted MPP superfamily phosphohydrolase
VPPRLIPIFLALAASQVGFYVVLRRLFCPAGGRRWLRLALAAPPLVCCLLLPLYGAAIRRGLEFGPLVRYAVAYPVLAWTFAAIPLSAILAVAISVAARWPARGGGGAAAAVVAEPDAPSPVPPAAAPVLIESRRRILSRGAVALLGGAAGVSIAGVLEAERQPVVSRVEIPLQGLHPDLDGLTLLQLSDIHAGTLVTEERMRAWAAQGAALRPDLVVLTGDLLDGSGQASGPFSRAFGGLSGPLGTYACLGNHDYFAGRRAAVRAVRDAAGTVLDNEGVRLVRGAGSLWLCGVDDPLGAPDPARALRRAAPGEPRILLAHRPGLADQCARAGANLILSGHTHGGQLALSRRLSPARAIGHYVMGYYPLAGGAQLYVHRGMGVVGAVPLRLGAPPELALLTLRRA